MSIPRRDIERETLDARNRRRTGTADVADAVERVLSDLDDVLMTLAAGDPPAAGDTAAFRSSAAALTGVLRARSENGEGK